MKLHDKLQKCKYSRFCSNWGEWKCVLQARKVNAELDCIDCKKFEKGSKEPDEKCHCETCLFVESLLEQERPSRMRISRGKQTPSTPVENENVSEMLNKLAKRMKEKS